MKMNTIFVKLLVTLLIILTLFNFICSAGIQPNYVYAEPDTSEESGDEPKDVSSEDIVTENDGALNVGTSSVSKLSDVVSNLALAPLNLVKLIVYALCNGARTICYKLASAGGTTAGVTTKEITPFDIFFNKFTLLDANIFSTTDRDGKPLATDSFVYKIRTNASIWYYAVRTIAILVISIVLLWNLIKMLSKKSSASQKAMAKNSLVDWVVSFALIMFMHIIVIAVLSFNDLLLQGIEKVVPTLSSSSNFYNGLEEAVWSTNIPLGISALVVYALLMWQTFKYILFYIQRLLTIVLLIMISPIVPVTYSLDKMKGGNGATLNSWLRELIYNVFIQILHAIVYVALVSVAMEALTSGTTKFGSVADLSTGVIAISALLFMKYAETMVKTIFGFDSSRVLNTNMFSDAVQSTVKVAGTVGAVGGKAWQTASRVGTRVANGGPVISFGQNMDGTHIGLGQVARGLANNAGQALTMARDDKFGIKSFTDGIKGIDTKGNAVKAVQEKRTVRMENKEKRKKSKRYTKAARKVDKEMRKELGKNYFDYDDENTIEQKEQYRKNRISAVIDEVNRKEALRKKNKKKTRKDYEDEYENNYENDNRKSENQNEQSSTVVPIIEDEKQIEKEIIKDSENVDTNKVQNNDSEQRFSTVNDDNKKQDEKFLDEIDRILGFGNETENIKEAKVGNVENMNTSNISTSIDESTKKALLDEFKTLGEAIKQNNAFKYAELDGKMIDKLNELEKRIGSERSIKLQTMALGDKSYVNTLPKNSDERLYVETLERQRFFNEMTNKEYNTNISDDEKFEDLKNMYSSQGLEIPQNVTLDNVSNLKFEELKGSIPSSKVERTTEVVEENVNRDSIINVTKNETKAPVSKEQAMGEVQEVLSKLGVKVRNEVDLQTDFESRVKAVSKLKNVKDKIDLSNMRETLKTDTMKKQYDDYKNGNIGLNDIKDKSILSALAIEEEAKVMRMMQEEARRNGFAVNSIQKSTSYEAKINVNGKEQTVHSSNTKDVLSSLNDMKKNA